MQQPINISEYSRKTVCFYMFVDEETMAFIRNNSAIDENKKNGLWRIVVVRNLPYTDARRTGKVNLLNFSCDCLFNVRILSNPGQRAPFCCDMFWIVLKTFEHLNG